MQMVHVFSYVTQSKSKNWDFNFRISEANIGVTQGGILSPIIFIIYIADMEEWIKHSCIFNYADVTESSWKDKW